MFEDIKRQNDKKKVCSLKIIIRSQKKIKMTNEWEKKIKNSGAVFKEPEPSGGFEVKLFKERKNNLVHTAAARCFHPLIMCMKF